MHTQELFSNLAGRDFLFSSICEDVYIWTAYLPISSLKSSELHEKKNECENIHAFSLAIPSGKDSLY